MFKKSLLFYFLFITFWSYSQNNEVIEKNDSLAIVEHDKSVTFYKKKDYKNAIKYALKEIYYLRKNKTHNNKIYKKGLYQLGLFYLNNKDYYNSIKINKIVVDSFSVDKRTYQAYCSIGRSYRNIGDFHQAITYYKKGLSNPAILGTKSLFSNTINFALCYDAIGTKEGFIQEKKLLIKADSLYNIGNFKQQKHFVINNNFGLYYLNDLVFNYNKSNYYFNKILQEGLKSKDTILQTYAYNNLSVLHNKVQSDSAKHFLEKGLKVVKKNSPIKPLLHLNLGSYFSINNENTLALKHIHKSLQLFIPVTIDPNPFSVTDIKNLNLAKNKYSVLDNLKEKTKCFLKLKKNHLALKNLKLADQLIEVIKSESFEKGSKLFWQKEASEIYMLGVNASYLLNKPLDALYFMEKNKAILLLENINEHKIREQGNIPISIIEKEFELKKAINDTENALNENKAKKDSLEKRYYSLKIEHLKFIESLKKEYPKYFDFKAPVEVISLQKANENLDKNTLLIEYILNKNDGYLLVSSRYNSKIYPLSETKGLLKNIENYQNLISKPFQTQKELNDFGQLSSNLCKSLLPFQKDTIMKGINKLLIIPDYTLQNIPFESLKNDNKYLIQDFEISYAYSLTFLEKNKKLQRNATQEIIAFAPIAFNYDNLKTLPTSETETKTINRFLNRKVLLDTSATKVNFFKEINNYKIIHLATHANANDSISPWIAFKNEKVYLNELYTTKNQAELVVLNACNSSLGKINFGEGVFSLARGFFYSGANSVVSSLWNVNDKSNAEITTSFYTYLKEGKTKSKSLRQAKLDYLNTHSLSEASPYYWSPLILIGDDSAIKLKSNLLFYILLSLSILILLFFILKKLKTVGNKS